MNDVFTVKCIQWYANFNILEPQFENILSKLILTANTRAKIIKEMETRMSASEGQRNDELLSKLKEYEQVERKIADMTDSYTSWKIDQSVFELSIKGVGNRIENLKKEILLLQDSKQTVEAGHKVIKLMSILETYDKKLCLWEKNKKSSQLFPIIFKGVANLIIDRRNIRSYQLFKPFDILEKCDNSQWRKAQDSNLRYLAVRTVSIGVH